MSFQERFVFSREADKDIIYNEHLARYRFAAKFVKNRKVLDIACGSGYGTRILAEAGALEAVGMDKNEASIRQAKQECRLKNVEYRVGDAEAIKVKENEFEVVVSFETIEHLGNQDKYLSELNRVVSGDGLVFISTPNKEVFGNKNPFHVRELTRSEFEESLKKHFPSVVIMEQGNGLVSFLKLAGEEKISESEITSVSEPLYFLAICSKRSIDESGFKGEGIGSVNVKAFENLKNNPVLRLSDKIYPFLMKTPGLKDLLEKFRN